MARLIDADRLYDQVEARYRQSSGEEHKAERALLDSICDSPTVDAIPVDWLQACIKIAELFCDEHNEKLLQTLINLWHRDGYGFFEKRTKED